MGLPGVKSKCWQGCLPLEALGKNPFSCLFHLLEAVCLPWFKAAFQHGITLTSSVFISPLPLILSSYKVPCDYIGPT